MTSQTNMPATNHESRQLDTSAVDSEDTLNVEQIAVPAAAAAMFEFHHAPHFRIPTRTAPSSGSSLRYVTNLEQPPIPEPLMTLDVLLVSKDQLQLEQHQHHPAEGTDSSSPIELASESVPDRGSWANEHLPDKSASYVDSNGSEGRQSHGWPLGQNELSLSDTISTTEEVGRLNAFDVMLMKTMNASISINNTEVLQNVPIKTPHHGQPDRSFGVSEPEEDTLLDSDWDRQDILNENEADESMTSSPQSRAIEYEPVEGSYEYNYYIVYDAVGVESASAADGNYYYPSPDLLKRDEEPVQNEFDNSENAVGSRNSFYPEMVEPSYYVYEVGDAVEPSDSDPYDALIAYPNSRFSAGRFFGPMQERISYESYSESPVFYDGHWNEEESAYDGSEQFPVETSVFRWPSTVARVPDEQYRDIPFPADSTESRQNSVSQYLVTDEEHPGTIAMGETVQEHRVGGIFQDTDDVTDYLEHATVSPKMIEGSNRNGKSAFDIAMINAVLNSRPRQANLAVVPSSKDDSNPTLLDGVMTGSKRRRRVGLWQSATGTPHDGSTEATQPTRESSSLPVVFDAHDAVVHDVPPKLFFSGVSAPTHVIGDAPSPLSGFRASNIASFDNMMARSSNHRPIVRRVVPDVYVTQAAAAASSDDVSWAARTPVIVVSASVAVAVLLMLVTVAVRQYLCCCESSISGGTRRRRKRTTDRENQLTQLSSKPLLGVGDRVQCGGASGLAHSMEYIVNTHGLEGALQKELKPPPMLFEVGHKFRTTVIIGDPTYALLASSSTPTQSDNWMVSTSGANEDQGFDMTAVIAELVPPTEADHPMAATVAEMDNITTIVRDNVTDGEMGDRCSVTSFVDACQVWINRDELPVAPDVAGLGRQLLASTTDMLTTTVDSSLPVRRQQDDLEQNSNHETVPKLVETNQPEVIRDAGAGEAVQVDARIETKGISEVISVSDIRAMFAASVMRSTDESDVMVMPKKPRFEVKSLDYAAKPVKH